jgi:hypothetical protein
VKQRIRIVLMSKDVRDWWIYPLFHKSKIGKSVIIGPILIYRYGRIKAR